jgi:hypothetical protein
VGRGSQKARLRQAIQNRQGLLIWGPAGIGKTALVMRVLEDHPVAAAGSIIYLSGVGGLRPLLCALLRRLYEIEDATLRRQLRNEGVAKATFSSWLQTHRASRLRGALYRSMEGGQYWVFLDHIPPLTLAVAKVVKELTRMRETPVYILARGLSEAEVGHVTDLYWSDRQRLSLGPLPARAARDLLEWCIRRFGLARLDLNGFRQEILHLSGHNPGTLIHMCALAAEPRYQSGSQIKTKLIHIDTLVSGYNSLVPPKLTESTRGGR